MAAELWDEMDASRRRPRRVFAVARGQVMGARGAFYKLSIGQYRQFLSAPDRESFLQVFETLNEDEDTGLFGEDDVGLMDKAWWGLFCILPQGIIDTDPIDCLGEPTEFGTQQLYVVEGRYWSLLSVARIQAIVPQWRRLDRAVLKDRYFALLEPLPRRKGWRGLFGKRRHWYADFVSEEDFEYVMGYCSDALRFLEEALADSRPVMFEGAG